MELIVPVAGTRHAARGSPGCGEAQICLLYTHGETTRYGFLRQETNLSRMRQFALSGKIFSLLGWYSVWGT